MPRIRPIDDIRKVSLLESAYLHDRPPSGPPPLHTSLRVTLAKIEISASEQLDDIKVLGTVMQLMSLLAIQARPKKLIDVKKKVLSQRGFGIEEIGSSTCWFRRPYAEFHLVMELDLHVTKAFDKR